MKALLPPSPAMLNTATERLLIRTLETADAPLYLRILNDPMFMRYVGDRGIRTEEQARVALEEGAIAMQREHGHALYLVQRKDGTALGMCGLLKRAALADVDLGYGFLPEFRGQGYAREAAAAVLQYAEQTLGLTRVAALTAPDHTLSIALLREFGFVYEGTVQLASGAPHSNLYLRLATSAAPAPDGQ
jgi:RimJ/RimL family protein N-acetyltransferase